MMLNKKPPPAAKKSKKTARQKEIEALMAKYGGEDKRIDMDELRLLLTDLDDNKHPPLPKDLLWCMKEGDQDGSGFIGKSELAHVLDMYKKYKEDADNIVDLIKKHDKNKDMQLDDVEMKALLSEAVGVPAEDISQDDIDTVNKYMKLTLNQGQDLDATSLAKAISRWDDEKNMSEGMFSNMLNMELPDVGKQLTEVWDGISCCGAEREKKANGAQV